MARDLQLAALQEIPAESGVEGVGAVRRERQGPLARIAFAAREVEIRLERPAVGLPQVAYEHEPVRLEQRAQVDLGQEPGVARVAGALEAVEVDRLERVDGSDL